MVDKFNEIGVGSFQITLDGEKGIHDKVRNKRGKGSYDTIMNNILSICKKMEDPQILLRINYTNKSLQTVDRIFDDIPRKFRSKINISFQRVWQTVQKYEETDYEIRNLLSTKMRLANQMGYNVSYTDSISSGFNRCYADRWWHTEINYDGSVYKCTTDYENGDPQGYLESDGTIKWDESIISKLFSEPTFNNKMCRNCKYLPACLGPCSKKMLEVKNGKTQLEQVCNLSTSELSFDELIINHYFNAHKYSKTLNEATSSF